MKKSIFLALMFTFIAPLTNATVAPSETVTPPTKITGKVTEIQNSSVFTLQDAEGQPHVIRLAHIWTPYANKPYGKEALAGLKELIQHKNVECSVIQKDKKGKNLSDVKCDGKSVQSQMVELGLAWVHQKYATDELKSLEAKAKEAKRGIWALPNPPGTKRAKVSEKA